MYIHKHNIRVRYPETDKMGIVYHANYITWFDVGRTEFFRSLGYDYRELEAKGIWIPVLEVGCEYKSPSFYDDEVTIETHIEELTKVKIKFAYEIKRDEKLLVKGFSKHCFTTDELRPIGLNKHQPEVYNRLLECCSGE